MTIKTIIIDDNIDDLTHLKTLCNKLDNVNVVETFTNPVKAFNYLLNNTIDLILSDIEMPDINGIEMIKNLDKPPNVIFTSSHPEFALKSFAVKPLHYLIKPIKLTELLKAIGRISNTAQNKNYIFIKQDEEYVKINLNEILYINAEANFVSVITPTNKYLVLANLTQFGKQLPANQFIRIHKSRIVNINKVEKYAFEHLIINNQLLPIGAFYRNDFSKIIKSHTIKRKI